MAVEQPIFLFPGGYPQTVNNSEALVQPAGLPPTLGANTPVPPGSVYFALYVWQTEDLQPWLTEDGSMWTDV